MSNTQNDKLMEEFLDQIEAGIVVINGELLEAYEKWLAKREEG